MRITQRARDAYADRIAEQGEQWGRLAQQIRDGFDNLWVKPALEAIELALGPDEDPA